MNPLGKLGDKIRYLSPSEQLYVKENKIPRSVSIDKLTELLKNTKRNKLTLDFIHGLFDGDGNITCYLTKDENQKLKIRVTFSFVQDIYNESLLVELQNYFNNNGHIYKISNKGVRYDIKSLTVLKKEVLPLMVNKS